MSTEKKTKKSIMDILNERPKPLVFDPHPNQVINAITYIAKALTRHQVINEEKIKKIVQRVYPEVTDEIFKESINILRKGLIITDRRNGLIYQTDSLDNELNRDDISKAI